MFLAENTKPKNRFPDYPKTCFSVLKNLQVTRFFDFGKNRVGNPITQRDGGKAAPYIRNGLCISVSSSASRCHAVLAE
jgi:hypothetical protein